MSARGGEQPRGATSLLLAGLVALAFFVYASRAQAQVNVLMHHNDLARTGQNLNETLLTPSNVNTQSFGLLFTQPVDGEVYAQPLYLSQVDFPDHTTHNLVFVVTAHDSVFAFDADSNVRTDAQPIWHASFTDPAAGITSVPIDDIAPDPVSPEVGITSTPVIDPDTQTIYVVARTKEAKGVTSVNVQRLHALDVRTGAENSAARSRSAPRLPDAAPAPMRTASSRSIPCASTNAPRYCSAAAWSISAGLPSAISCRITGGSLVMMRKLCDRWR